MNLVRTSTLLKVAALTSLVVFPSYAAKAKPRAKAKSYENFDLPKYKEYSVVPKPPSEGLSYTSQRLSLRGTNLRLDQPSVNAQSYVFAKEAFLTEKRDEAIKLLRQELDAGLKRNRDNLLLRLGQLYAEKYMELSYRENELYTANLADFEKKKLTDKAAKAPRIDNSRSQGYLTQAMDLFTALEKEFPNHPKIDEVIFFIGFVYMETGKTEPGMRYLERVVRNYPKSRKYEEALVYLGDFHFEKTRFRDAMAKYRILAARKDSSLYHYAAYKIAWCELNTTEPNKALTHMKALISELKGAKEPSKFNLREQALKDLVVFYGETGKVEEAMDYFEAEVGKDKALSNLRLIADLLRSKARDQEAYVAYSRLLQEFPNSPESPRLHLGLYECSVRIGKIDKGVKELVVALEKFGTGGEWLKNVPDEKKAEARTSAMYLGTEAEKAALFFHSSAQKSSNKVSSGYALKIYDAILASYPDWGDRKKIAFYRGEIFFGEGKWLEAAKSYMVAARTPPKDKVADESAYNALLALDRLTAKNDNLDRYTKEQQKTVDMTPQPIPSNEQQFIEVAEYYQKEYPQGSRVVDVKFRIAAIYYKFHHFDKSQAMFRDVALKHPKHRAAATAAHIVLDIHNLKKDYAALDTEANAFAKVEGLGDATFKAEMAQIAGELGFKKIEGLEASNKWKEAGDNYYSFYKANSTGPLAEKSLYNAYVSYEKASDTVKASEVSKLFVAKYPKSEYTKRFTLNLGRLAEKQYDFDLAQKYYQEFNEKFPADKEAPKALYNAALFAELLDKNKTALELYDKYLRTKTVSPEERKAVYISQAKLHRKLGDWDKVNLIYRRLIRDAQSQDEKLAFLGELGHQYEKAGKRAEREGVMKELRWMYDSSPSKKLSGPAVQYIAEARFRAVTPQREKYEKVVLRFPPEDLAYLLKRKQNLLVKLAASYDQVVDVGVPDWGVAALYEKSEAFANYVKNFRTLSVPGRYKPEERTVIEGQMKQIDASTVKPLEAKVGEFLRNCVAKAAQFYVANEYAAKCRENSLKFAAAEARENKDPKVKPVALNPEPAGLFPQPSYWTTRWFGEGLAQK